MPVPEDWRASLKPLFAPLGSGRAQGRHPGLFGSQGEEFCTPEQQQPGVQSNLGNYSFNCTKNLGKWNILLLMDAPSGRGQRQWDGFFPLSVKLELFPVQACGFWLDPSQALHFTRGPGTCLAQGLMPGSPLKPPHLLPTFFPFL